MISPGGSFTLKIKIAFICVFTMGHIFPHLAGYHMNRQLVLLNVIKILMSSPCFWKKCASVVTINYTLKDEIDIKQKIIRLFAMWRNITYLMFCIYTILSSNGRAEFQAINRAGLIHNRIFFVTQYKTGNK